MKRLRAALPLILLLIAGIVLYLSGTLDRLGPQHLIAHQQQVRAHIAEYPWLSRLTYIGLLTLAMATGIPGTVIIILAGGFAFGVLDGTLCSSAGLTLGSLILYLASRYAFGTGTREPPPFAAKLHHGFERHPVTYTLFLRFVPVMPFGAVTVGLAWLRCPLWLFLGASWLGGTVSLVFENSIGAGLGSALDSDGALNAGLLLHRSVLLPMAALALLALLPLLIGRLTQRWRRQAPPPDKQE
ncbi:VTT domain-containing protein [Rhodanobacter sp. DHG33]|uniref:TVP38/TMEM64 family protein n=1 Tax=Rhodanobacter sp. DHG33 TaxID=2775921 RepID=UPI0017824989|nr:VTT domain-containing protein [Rhodanobacter sp. DHG33]MBD8897971.1 TVP38/TMEM64 family protein [Rhodanobacter sp. DHG33]